MTRKGGDVKMEMKLDARIEERTSKAGNKYQVLVLKLTNTYEKDVFLDKPEIELLNISLKDNKNNPFAK